MSFEQYLQGKGLSERVIKSYRAEVSRHQRFLDQQGKSPEGATKKDLLDYLQSDSRLAVRHRTVKRPLSNRTKRGILGILNHYYSYLMQQGRTVQNPTRFIRIRGIKKRELYRLFTEEELEQLCELLYQETCRMERPTLQQQKDYLLLTLVAYQGLQVHEVARLERSDLDLHKGILQVRGGRKTNARTLPLKAAQIGLFMQYFGQQEEAGLVSSKNYLHSLNGLLRRLCPHYCNFIQLRASVITCWIKQHGLRKAQYLAGHRYISSTEHYLHNDLEQLQNDLDLFHPLN